MGRAERKAGGDIPGGLRPGAKGLKLLLCARGPPAIVPTQESERIFPVPAVTQIGQSTQRIPVLFRPRVASLPLGPVTMSGLSKAASASGSHGATVIRTDLLLDPMGPELL